MGIRDVTKGKIGGDTTFSMKGDKVNDDSNIKYMICPAIDLNNDVQLVYENDNIILMKT